MNRACRAGRINSNVFLWGLVWLTALFCSSTVHANELVVIELNGRTAEDVIPLLQPMLAPGGSISGLNDKLIIRTTPSNLAELKSMLEVIDAPPRSLLVTVRQGNSAREREVDVEVSGSIGNNGASVTVPEAQSEGIEVRARAQDSGRSGNTIQSIRVLEGNPAYIAVGQSIPIRGSTGADGREYVEYRDVVTGFYATPRVRGQRVTVALSTSADTVSNRVSGAARIQRADTVVSGELGEWIEVGSISGTGDNQETGIIFFRSNRSDSQRTIYLKVDEVR